MLHTSPIEEGQQIQQDGFRVRNLQAEELEEVNEMLVEEYGSSYPYPLKELAADRVYLVVEEQQTGRIVAFARAAPYHGHGRIYELGGLIVARQFRGRKLAKWLTTMRLRHCKVLGAKACVSEPVCYRINCESQYNLLRFGFVLLGIQPGKYPGLQADHLQGQPESVVMAARWLEGDSGFGRRKIFVPKELRGVPALYLPRMIRARKFEQELRGELPPVVEHEARMGVATVGAEFRDIPANWEGSRALIHESYTDGWEFSCVLPGFGTLDDGTHFDYIRLYRFPRQLCGFNFSRVHVAEYLLPLRSYMAGQLMFGRR